MTRNSNSITITYCDFRQRFSCLIGIINAMYTTKFFLAKRNAYKLNPASGFRNVFLVFYNGMPVFVKNV